MKHLIFISPIQKKVNAETKGFTLVELLIVLTILALLAVATVLVLNPVEIIRKSRDTQRISDLNNLKSALALYVTTATTPYLGASASDANCIDGGADKLFVSYPSDAPTGGTIADLTPPAGFTFVQVTNANVAKNDANGWMPVNFTNTGSGLGAPVGQLPSDPLNALGGTDSLTVITGSSTFYRYGCNGKDAAANKSTFEIDAKMESSYYLNSPNNVAAQDGGDNASLLEVGTLLTILPSTNDF